MAGLQVLHRVFRIFTPLMSWYVSICIDRRRPDRSQLAAGNTTASGAEKYRLEEMQRAEKRERIARGEQWTPKYFRKPEQETPLTGEARPVTMWSEKPCSAAQSHTHQDCGAMKSRE